MPPSEYHVGLRDPREINAPAISFSQGAEWNALISRYIGTMPPSGDICDAPTQSMSDAPSDMSVNSAMMAKVGAAASDSKSMPRYIEQENDEIGLICNFNGGAPPLPLGEGWGEGFRSIDKP
jgi:hypothetical protein